MKRLLYILPIVIGVAVLSCKKETATNVEYTAYGVSSTQGQLKIVYASAYAANPSVLLKINGMVVSSSITGRTPFPGGGFNTTGSNYPLYLLVPRGNDTVSVSIVKVGTNTDSIVFYKTIVNIPDSAAYTLHIADTLVNSTVNNTISLLVKNDITTVDSGYSRYRFVNLIPNVVAPNGAVDLYLNGVKIISNIAYKQASDTFRVALGANAPGVTDPNNIPTPTWVIRAGTTSSAPIIATYASVNTMGNRRVFTIFSMGYSGITTGTRIPYVSFTLDKND